MSGIRKSLLQLIFSGSFMKRWNDKLRPMELIEVDKQAHKMITAWTLFFLNCQGLDEHDRMLLGEEIIEGCIFEYFYRLIITDIKPPVFYKIKANPDHYRQLTEWVIAQLQPRVQPLGKEFSDRLQFYFLEESSDKLSCNILEAAHLFASRWEFNLIKGINPWDEELEEIEENFENSLKRFSHLEGVSDLMAGSTNPLGRFLHQCGQLRFQKRWSQTPRIPETSVLGHMFIVACYAYFFSLAVEAAPVRRQNTFFAGLFHDLPELLTRDIISPVKRSVQGIGDLIKEYEESEVKRRVFGLLEKGGYQTLSERLGYYLGVGASSEFANTIKTGDQVWEVGWQEIQEKYNKDVFDPKDGKVLQICDSLAAFIEAYTAMRNGITTDQLQQAVWRIRSLYAQTTLGEKVHVGGLLADFD